MLNQKCAGFGKCGRPNPMKDTAINEAVNQEGRVIAWVRRCRSCKVAYIDVSGKKRPVNSKS